MNESRLEAELQEMEKVYNFLLTFLLEYSVQIFAALVIFLIGLWLANKASLVVERILERHKVDVTLTGFATNLVRIGIIVMVAIVALGKLGISVTPFIAAIGAASLGAGLALQGMLSNYAAGITIIIMRPFAVGNTITVQEVTGVVDKIRLGMTLLTNEDGEVITIPNKHIIGEILHNSFNFRMVETILGISYEDDPEKAIEAISVVLARIPEIASDPLPQVGVDSFGDSSVNIGVRFWVPTVNYYECKYRANLAMYQAIGDAGITIPFPQRVVHLEQG